MSTTDHTVPRLRLRGVGKRFGRRTVLDHVDLDVDPGTIVLLAGSNGSGKTTLLRGIAGLARVRGELAIDGVALTGAAADRRAIGYLPQAVGLPAWATVHEVLALFAALRGSDRMQVDLPDEFLPPLDQVVGQLSGGQRQRVAFAVALLGAPRLLLLDEPAANLDEDGRRTVVEHLARLRDAGTSVLIAAPSPSDLAGLPDRLVRLVGGRVESPPHLRALPGTDDGALPGTDDGALPGSDDGSLLQEVAR